VTGAVSLPLAHGIGGVRDLPVPLWLFYYGAGIVLIVSFAALGALWKRPLLATAAEGRGLGRGISRVLLGPELRIVLGALSIGLFALVFAASLVGRDSVATNIAPTFVYVVFWVGLVGLVVGLGNVWPALNPWDATARLVGWIGSRIGPPWTPPARYPARLGRWPAAFLLFAFVTLELAYPDSASPRVLALAIAVYSWITWLGMATFGREEWLRHGEAFTVYFGLLARLSPFTARDGRVVARPPSSGLAGPSTTPGTMAFVAVMLGSVAFDGFSNTRPWQERLFSIEARLALDNPGLADLALTGFNLLGLVGAIVLVALLFLVAVEGARLAARVREPLAADFVLSLVPIALAYAVAHYFSLFVLQGQAAWRLISDPFGFGWNLFGTADHQVQLGVLSPNTTWYVQVGALVVGHVAGLAIAHDRAVALFGSAGAALRTQYAMLVLMIAYTVGGLWLLSTG
jgi:hypothetical protein